MNQQKKTFVQRAFTVTFLVGFPFLVNACVAPNPLKGQGIQLWGGDDDKKASTASAPPPQKQAGNRPATPVAATPPCKPNLSNSTLDPADPKLVKLIESAKEMEKKVLKPSDIRARLADLSKKHDLELNSEQIDNLAREFVKISRNQQTPAEPAPRPSAAPSVAPSDSYTIASASSALPEGSDAARTAEPATKPSTTPGEAARATPPSKFRPSVIALEAYDRMLELVKRQKNGLETDVKDMPKQGQEYTLRMLGTNPPELAFVAIDNAFDQAFALTDSSPKRSRLILEKIMTAHKGKEAAALTAWVNAYKAESIYSLDAKEAMKAANKVVCYEPEASTDTSDSDRSKNSPVNGTPPRTTPPTSGTTPPSIGTTPPTSGSASPATPSGPADTRARQTGSQPRPTRPEQPRS